MKTARGSPSPGRHIITNIIPNPAERGPDVKDTSHSRRRGKHLAPTFDTLAELEAIYNLVAIRAVIDAVLGGHWAMEGWVFEALADELRTVAGWAGMAEEARAGTTDVAHRRARFFAEAATCAVRTALADRDTIDEPALRRAARRLTLARGILEVDRLAGSSVETAAA